MTYPFKRSKVQNLRSALIGGFVLPHPGNTFAVLDYAEPYGFTGQFRLTEHMLFRRRDANPRCSYHQKNRTKDDELVSRTLPPTAWACQAGSKPVTYVAAHETFVNKKYFTKISRNVIRP